MLSLIKSLHKGTNFVMRVRDSSTEWFEVTNGLRQGYTLAPTLFNLYFTAMVDCWRTRHPQAGVIVKYSTGRKLVGERTMIKARLREVRVTESQIEDDVMVYVNIREELEHAAEEFVKTTADWGLTVSLEKTNFLTMGKQLRSNDDLPVNPKEGEIAILSEFTGVNC